MERTKTVNFHGHKVKIRQELRAYGWKDTGIFETNNPALNLAIARELGMGEIPLI